ncbi:MAG: OmpH family outer membrane protein [Nitrospirota bacterium]
MRRGDLLIVSAVVLLMLDQAAGLAAEAFKVAVIDQQAILERTKSGKRIVETMKEFATSRQRILAADDEELKGLEKELREQGGGMSEAARRDKQEAFRVKFEGYQRRVQEFNREIQSKQKELGDEYMKKINAVVTELAKKEGYVAVLDRGSEATMKIVIYSRSTIDLTDQAVKEIDRRFP